MPRAPAQQVEELFDAALAEPVDRRDAFVREACGDDEGLYREVVQLLQADAMDGGLLDTPVAIAGAQTARPHDEQPLATGDLVGDYVIEARIGAGGFGAVYRARHPVIGKQAAVKVLHAEHTASDGLGQRFVREARAVNEIGHPNIIDIFGFGQTPDGRLFYAMEYLDAPTLEAVLRRDGPMSLPVALPILRGLAAALDAAHARGIVHRDLKPANVILQRDPDGAWTPKLLDFGIAKLVDADEAVEAATQTGQLIGTPAYMAPEQIRNADIDGRTDAYALGVLSFRMLTGRLPFSADNPFDMMVQHTQTAAPPPSSVNPSLGPAVDAFVGGLLHKQAEDRPSALAPAVAALAEGAIADTRAHTGAWRLLVIVVVALVVAVGGWLWLAGKPPAATPDARPERARSEVSAPVSEPAAGSTAPPATPASAATSTGAASDEAPDPEPTTAATTPPTTVPPAPRRNKLNADLESPFDK